MTKKSLRQKDLNAFLESVYHHYGYDFRQYARESVTRRIEQRLREERLSTLSELNRLIIKDKRAADALLRALSINVTEMFRDPDFYLELSRKIIPILKAQPHIKIWHAGCATGEEPYSMAILLHEEELYKQSLLYATDFNNRALKAAERGLLPLARMRQNSKNYLLAGGKGSLADYYYSNYGAAAIERQLLLNIRFSHHNLVTDDAFAEVDLIVCRNVLIYFNPDLQQRVCELFYNSLCKGGILCLGSHESLRPGTSQERFTPLSVEHRIFQKVN